MCKAPGSILSQRETETDRHIHLERERKPKHIMRQRRNAHPKVSVDNFEGGENREHPDLLRR